MKLIRSKIVFLLLAFFATLIVFGCGVGNDDFSDTEYIQKMIKDDAEGLYEPGLTDDGDSLFFASLSKEFSKSNASEFWKTAANGFSFGRFIEKVERKNIDVFIEQDTLAYVTVDYLLSGWFRIDSSGVSFSAKPLRHQLSRTLTFVKRENPRTGEKWKPVTFSAAHGSSLDPATLAEDTKLALDSIWIKTATHLFAVDNSADIVNYYKNPITVSDGDTIRIIVKIRNRLNIMDKPVGFLTNGKNRDKQFRRRLEFGRIPLTDYFVKTIIIESSQKREYNQLVIDFLTQSTINRRAFPYDSHMIAIPYYVQ